MVLSALYWKVLVVLQVFFVVVVVVVVVEKKRKKDFNFGCIHRNGEFALGFGLELGLG